MSFNLNLNPNPAGRKPLKKGPSVRQSILPFLTLDILKSRKIPLPFPPSRHLFLIWVGFV